MHVYTVQSRFNKALVYMLHSTWHALSSYSIRACTMQHVALQQSDLFFCCTCLIMIICLWCVCVCVCVHVWVCVCVCVCMLFSAALAWSWIICLWWCVCVCVCVVFARPACLCIFCVCEYACLCVVCMQMSCTRIITPACVNRVCTR